MKTCSECETPNGLAERFCGACGQVLEERTYLSTIGVCSVLGVAVHRGLRKAGIYSRFSIGEVLITATIFLLILYPAYKLFQKWREPSRPIGQEMLSVHGDRWSRVMLLGLLSWGAWLLLKPGSVGDAVREPLVLHVGFKAARAWMLQGMLIVSYGLVLLSRPQLGAIHAIVGGEMEDTAHHRETRGRRALHSGVEILHPDGTGLGPVALPQLDTTHPIIRREVERRPLHGEW